MIAYIRDKRSPKPKNENVSKVMRSNKAKNTKPELLFRKALCEAGLRGYRLHWKNVPGKPDIAFVGKKVAIFINGCYWHRCPFCNPSFPKTNVEFWSDKFEKNIARDKKKKEELEKDGWKVIILWECKIKKELQACINEVKSRISKLQ